MPVIIDNKITKNMEIVATIDLKKMYEIIKIIKYIIGTSVLMSLTDIFSDENLTYDYLDVSLSV